MLIWCTPLSADIGELPEALNGAFSIDSFEIGEATLADIQAYLGLAALKRTADGLAVSICYSQRAPATIKVTFESSVLGGLERLTAIELTTKVADDECAQPKNSIATLRLGRGISLSQTRKQFEESLPLKFDAAGLILTYSGDFKRHASQAETERIRARYPKLSGEVMFDISVDIEAAFMNGRLYRYRISRLESF